MNTTINIRLTILAVAILIVIALGYTFSFRNDIPVCTGYLTNVYLYTTLALLLLGLFVSFLTKVNFGITGTKGLITGVIAAVILYGFYTISSRSVITNHVTWIALIAVISLSAYAFWRHSTRRGLYSSVYLNTLILSIVLTYVVYTHHEFPTMRNALLIAGGVYIFTALTNKYTLGIYSTPCEKIAAVLLSLLITYLALRNYPKLRGKGSNCTFPDYPKDSLQALTVVYF